jgi:DNA replication and repair protein RecF
MSVRSVHLANVRCRRELRVDLGEGLTVLVGPNGAGKTTVLEALALLLRGVTLRPGVARDLITAGQDYLRVEADIEQDELVVTAGAAFSREGQRRLTAGGAPIEDLERWRRAVPLQTFMPDDLRLVKGGPWRRREYLDALASVDNPGHADLLRRYGEALSQRNALLRTLRSGADGDQFGPWEDILAQTGLAVSDARATALARLVRSFQIVHSQLTGEPEGAVRLVYRTNVADLGVESYRKRLEEMRVSDRRRTYTQLGPHRDDLRLIRSGLDMRDCASQGEQRAAVLSLVLAEWLRMCSLPGTPLLLLDDVMSELDEERRRALIKLLHQGAQAIITTTDLRYFSSEELHETTVVTLEAVGAL